VIMLDGIEYLCLFNDFNRVQMFVEHINDLVMASGAILLIPLDPQSLDQRSLARLRRYAEVVQ
jgi:archaellum biogenesis ATPase FlaH